ncbi:hypothetical protein EVAR_59599_1 [Eumeta japonica]|uniref:DUF5641 domain-containing protein n=1 Tax=Eumeta variegata TaxID=151549 RepID=A0A4C1Z3K1_EUMVA|nr:hypothetical protein EVAR_59599_1 [Eumeta japonica]
MAKLFEVAIKSVKTHLRTVIAEKKLSFEELFTVFCKIKIVLKLRPSCPLLNDPNDSAVLTPGHFVIGQPLIAVPELLRFNGCNRPCKTFGSGSSPEYLHTLKQRYKWTDLVASLHVRDLDLIKQDNFPPSSDNAGGF